jgi:hypothetical protein
MEMSGLSVDAEGDYDAEGKGTCGCERAGGFREA